MVLAPGLLSGLSASFQGRENSGRTTRHLSRLLGLAEQSELADSEDPCVESLVACALLQNASSTEAARCGYLKDFPASADRSDSLHGGAAVLRADPAYQQIDMNNATLGNPAELDLSTLECDALLQTLNDHFAPDGIRFEYSETSRWYCHFENLIDVTTYPLSAAIGRDVSQCKPTGPDARQWRRNLAEIEMLLFEHVVNTDRQARGQLPVNTLWLWGEGGLNSLASENSLTTENVSLYSDNFYTCSIAECYNLTCDSLDKTIKLPASDSAALIVTDKFTHPSVLQNADEFRRAMQWFEDEVCSAVWRHLHKDRCTVVTLWCGDQRLFHINAAAKKRFWKSAYYNPAPLSSFIKSGDETPQRQPGMESTTGHVTRTEDFMKTGRGM